MQKNHKVLLIGSGLMTGPLIDYLISFQDTYVTIASNLLEDAQLLASRNLTFLSAIYLDVFDVSPSSLFIFPTLILVIPSRLPRFLSLSRDILRSPHNAPPRGSFLSSFQSSPSDFFLHFLRDGSNAQRGEGEGTGVLERVRT